MRSVGCIDIRRSKRLRDERVEASAAAQRSAFLSCIACVVIDWYRSREQSVPDCPQQRVRSAIFSCPLSKRSRSVAEYTSRVAMLQCCPYRSGCPLQRSGPAKYCRTLLLCSRGYTSRCQAAVSSGPRHVESGCPLAALCSTPLPCNVCVTSQSTAGSLGDRLRDTHGARAVTTHGSVTYMSTRTYSGHETSAMARSAAALPKRTSHSAAPLAH